MPLLDRTIDKCSPESFHISYGGSVFFITTRSCTGDVEKIVISLTRVNVILSLSLHVYAPREKKSRSDGDENRTGYMHTFQDACVQECVD